MIKKNYLFLFLLLFFLSNCATILKGYNDKVSLFNPPKDLKIETKDGINIPYFYDKKVVAEIIWNDSTKSFDHTMADIYHIQLRSNQSHILHLKSASYETTIVMYPKMGAGWLILDTFTGVFPIFFDMYTGCFNHFDDIHFEIE